MTTKWYRREKGKLNIFMCYCCFGTFSLTEHEFEGATITRLYFATFIKIHVKDLDGLFRSLLTTCFCAHFASYPKHHYGNIAPPYNHVLFDNRTRLNHSGFKS